MYKIYDVTQLAVDFDWTVKMVDLKSLRHVPVGLTTVRCMYACMNAC